MERIGGKYDVLRLLGEGATSAVYLCYDPFAEREVAVKWLFQEVLKDAKRGRQFRHLLQNEASLAGRLVHPHIVQIYDAVIGRDESYIVMEYVPGGTLEPYCTPDQLLPIERVVEIIFKCSHALEYANRHGITHRDIKPANILLARADASPDHADGDIKISDFGASIQDGDAETQTQVMGVGSPAYMSPEQLSEQQITHQTDIYSLGVVMYQLLTGRLPFQAGSSLSMFYQICNTEPLPPSAFRHDLPPALDAIVGRAMQKSLTDRYASWAAFAHDLAQAFRSHELALRQQSLPDSKKFESLRELRFFDDFTDVEIWEIVRIARWDVIAAGGCLMRDGEAGDFFCLILEGEFQIAKAGHPIGQLGRGEIIGEIAVLDRRHHQRIADVTAIGDCRIVTVAGQALRQASEGCRMHFYLGFLQVLATRLARTNVLLAHT